MTKIEDFERTASDPNRFFVKGNFEFSFRSWSIALNFMSILILLWYAGAHEKNGGLHNLLDKSISTGQFS